MKLRMIVITPTETLFNEVMVPYYMASCFGIAAGTPHGEGVNEITTRYGHAHDFAVCGFGGCYRVVEGELAVGNGVSKYGDVQVVFVAEDNQLPLVDEQDTIIKHILFSTRPNSVVLKETLHLPIGLDDFRQEMWGRSLLIDDYNENLSLEQWLHG